GSKGTVYGVRLIKPPALQVTAGIAADGVRRVVVVDDRGRHSVAATGNALLYVAMRPGLTQRVRRILVGTAPVPFVPGPASYYGPPPPGSARRTALGPPHGQRGVRHGRSGWLDRRELRGEPVAESRLLRPQVRRVFHESFGRIAFSRAIRPDPRSRERIAIT